jgi:hypothetical protein
VVVRISGHLNFTFLGLTFFHMAKRKKQDEEIDEV